LPTPDLSQLILDEALLNELRATGGRSTALECDLYPGAVAVARRLQGSGSPAREYPQLRLGATERPATLTLPVLLADPPPGDSPYLLAPVLPLGDKGDPEASAEAQAMREQPWLKTLLERSGEGLLLVGEAGLELLVARTVATYDLPLWQRFPVTVTPLELPTQGTAGALGGKRVGLVGLGSVGSEIARLLALAGVGALVLIDPDTIERRNLRRHLCGPEDLGRLKAEAVADILRARGFTGGLTPVVTHCHRERADEVRTLLFDCDLLICAADSGVAAQFVNHCAVAQKRPAIIVSVQLRPEPLGEVVVVTQDGGCFACHRLQQERRLKDERPQAHDPHDYPDPVQDENAPDLPYFQLSQLAGIACDRMALAAQGSPSAVWLLPVEGTVSGYEMIDPRHIMWTELARESHCLVCRTLR
jgi:hypothetical protein